MKFNGMNNRDKVGLLFLLIVGLVLLLTLLLQGTDIAVLQPKGLIAEQERGLMVFATLLSLIVVLPVFAMTFFIAWKYRESNTKAQYRPDWDHNASIEAIWWGVPLILILVLSVVTWQSTHKLDPFKPLDHHAKPIKIQVIALQWKWLFIYPQQDIATINYIRFPKNTPINFEITADAPMNSFWIPQLGGQMYAMSGMSTKLHLIASESGRFKGLSANISGRGFAGMKFVAQASTASDFEAWVESVKHAPKRLNSDEYDKLAVPSENNPPFYYSSHEPGLYDNVVMKYLQPDTRYTHTQTRGGE